MFRVSLSVEFWRAYSISFERLKSLQHLGKGLYPSDFFLDKGHVQAWYDFEMDDQEVLDIIDNPARRYYWSWKGIRRGYS